MLAPLLAGPGPSLDVLLGLLRRVRAPQLREQRTLVSKPPTSRATASSMDDLPTLSAKKGLIFLRQWGRAGPMVPTVPGVTCSGTVLHEQRVRGTF